MGLDELVAGWDSLRHRFSDHYEDHRRLYAGVAAVGSFATNLYYGATIAEHGADVGSYELNPLVVATSAVPWMKASTAALYRYCFFSKIKDISTKFDNRYAAFGALLGISLAYKGFECGMLAAAGADHPVLAMLPSIPTAIAGAAAATSVFRDDEGVLRRLMRRYRENNRFLTLNLTPQLAREQVYNNERLIS